jgi:FixJ family two-component response regulator
VKKPASVFIVDRCAALSSSLEAILKAHDFPVECFQSAAQLIAKHHAGGRTAVFSLIAWCAESLCRDVIRERSRK